MFHLNTLPLTRVQPADCLDVDEVNFLQVQNDRESNRSDLSAHFVEVHGSKLTGHVKSSPGLLANAFDFQRQCRVRIKILPCDSSCKYEAIRNALAYKGLVLIRVPNSRDFPKNRENPCRTSWLSDVRGNQLSGDLNRYLSIPRRWIFESSVDVGTPSLAAAPVGPDTRP
jgi:hypothetical protein